MRWRLGLLFVGLTVMVLLVHDIPLARHLAGLERARLVTSLERDAFMLAGRAEDRLGAGDAAQDIGLRRVVDEYAARTGASVVITDVGPVAVASSGVAPQRGADLSGQAEMVAALAGQPSSAVRDSPEQGDAVLAVAVPVLSGPEVMGVVRLTYPADVVDARVAARVRRLLVVAAISIASAAIVAALVATQVTRSLRRLRAATDNLTGGDLSTRAATDHGPPEVRTLARSFNTMAERLERVLQRQRAFSGDASHQLRTPLTALRLRIEQASELLESDPALARARLDAAGAETERLQRLIEGLLMLARAEGQRTTVEIVDASAVARSRVDSWDSLAQERYVRLSLSAVGRHYVFAVPGAVEQILDNYLDNALEVAPPGSVVHVRVAVDEECVDVHVEDQGPGLSDEELVRSFDRFWQAQRSTDGVGLGLAIVQQLAVASGATVALRRLPGGGIDAVASFACARREPATLPGKLEAGVRTARG